MFDYKTPFSPYYCDKCGEKLGNHNEVPHTVMTYNKIDDDGEYHFCSICYKQYDRKFQRWIRI